MVMLSFGRSALVEDQSETVEAMEDRVGRRSWALLGD